MVEPDVIQALSAKLIAEHRIVEAAWVGFRLRVIPPGLAESEIDQMKMGFFAGAIATFGGMMEKLRNAGGVLQGDAVAYCQRLDRELRDYCDDLDCSDG